MKNYKNILFATDFSESNEVIAKRAKEVAEHYGAQLHLIHVLQYHPALFTGALFATSASASPEKILLEQSKEHLEAWAKNLGLDSKYAHTENGSPKHIIKKFAQDHDIDLIIIGAHSHEGLDILLGSTANSILQSAPCDVLVLKNKED